MPPTPLPEALRAHLAVSFDLLSPLGEGGMGVVWLARDRLLDREVAIKVLRAETADDPESARRFLQEARLAARLQHPGVVPLLTFGEVEGTRFYVMPYVRGETLADRIARGPIPEPEVRRIVAEVADALAYVHAKGIVHRDVKPANILIEAGTGRVVLADFGIARGTDGATSLTATGMVVGTPLYLAPEQAMGGAERVDGRADLYALGVVAWEALAGASPFAGATPQEVMGRKVSGGVPDVRERVPSTSLSFAVSLARALAPAAADRWGSATELATAVRERGSGDDVPAGLRPLVSAGSNRVLAAVPLATASYLALGSTVDALPLAWRLVLPSVAGVVSALLLAWAGVHGLRREYAPDQPWERVWILAMRRPRWWPLWWPARWTPPRGTSALPAWIRTSPETVRARASIACLFAIPSWIMVLVQVTATSEELGRLMGTAAYQLLTHAASAAPFLLLGGFALSAWPMVGVQRTLLRRGLTQRQVNRLLAHINDPDVPLEPWMEPFLDPETSGTETPTPQTLPALVQAIAIEAAARRAEGWPIDDLAPVLADAERADVAWERELAALEADADPAEVGRLRERLERLRAAPERDAQGSMRALLEQQLSLMLQAESTRANLAARRDRLRAGAEVLLRQLRALRAIGSARETPAELTGALRALADGVPKADADVAARTSPST